MNDDEAQDLAQHCFDQHMAKLFETLCTGLATKGNEDNAIELFRHGIQVAIKARAVCSGVLSDEDSDPS